jgi:hypothetical protein
MRLSQDGVLSLRNILQEVIGQWLNLRSAVKFSTPGKWTAVIQILLLTASSQISRALELHFIDLVPLESWPTSLGYWRFYFTMEELYILCFSSF